MEESKSSMQFEPSSYKDPDAVVFYKDGEVYRKISKKYIPVYEKLMKSGLFKKLLCENLIVNHNEEFKTSEELVIKPEKVFISYPWEWCFSQLKDAALATLKIQKTALEFDMTLKDATPFNIQFLNNKPVLIDTTSFEEFKEKPWSAYRQFCENFLAPLALIAYTDLNLTSLFLGSINGISLELASKLLPFKCRFNFNLLFHIFIHSKMQDKYASNTKKADVKIKKDDLINIVDNLYNTVLNINLKKYKTVWQEYYSNTNYSKNGFETKKEIIDLMRQKIAPKTVIDFGCNTGIFSRIFSNNGAKVLSCDIDKLAIEKNYLLAKENTENNIFPIVFDIVNPSPALGFNNKERKTLKERLKEVDLTLALALIHHLSIGCNIPFSNLRDYFAQFSKYLIIEFVDKKDSKIQTMLLNREDIFDKYTQENFENVFKERYEIIEQKQIPSSLRTIYLMKRAEG